MIRFKVERVGIEQETRRKLLQTELNKLRNEVSESIRQFDYWMGKLFRKVGVV